MRRYLLLTVTAACTSSTAEPQLAANADSLAVEMNMPADLAVLDNDDGVDDAPTVVLETQPSHGDATLDAMGLLHYAPGQDFLGDDTLDYRVTNADGTTAVATVTIKVDCATCAIGGSITLAWDPNAPSDNIVGYRIYMGADMDTTMFSMLDDLMVGSPGFDPAAPSVKYDSWQKLHLRVGQQICFALTAYNSAGESGFSNVACGIATKDAMRFGL